MSARGSPVSRTLHAGNMTFMRKQAKVLLRAYREGDAEALQRVRLVLPARSDPADRQPPAGIRLADAQFVVARELGFASWPKLKEHLETHGQAADRRDQAVQAQDSESGDVSMTTQTALNLSAIDQIGLNCTDLAAAERFYTGVLGLPMVGDAGNMKFFDCDGVHLVVFESAEVSPNSIIYFKVQGAPGRIQEACEKLKAAGVAVDSDGPHVIARNWKGHDVWLAFFRDPFGNRLALKSDVPVG